MTRAKKVEAPEPNDEEKAAMGEPVTVPQTTPDYVGQAQGTPDTPVFSDMTSTTAYARAAMNLLYAETHSAGADDDRQTAAAWTTFGNNLRALGL